MPPTANHIRQQFVDFFVDKHGHQHVPSSPVVPLNDPTLLFANAGMNQFKPYFLGTETPPQPPRVANSQKCIRAGGKHNDLDDVGKDTYHHTFFEMLGNWSFGDYFKQEAIDWAWELLTSDQWWGLDPERLHATYFEGDAAEGLEPDLEAKELWLKYLPPERVHPGNKKDNFWEMGDTGPCGPCSEVHYDRTPDKSGASLVNGDSPDVIEIWNLVFIQFNRRQDQTLAPLPAKHVDTGMGFERIVAVLQGKDSNYDTDVFAPIFAAIQQVTGARAYTPGGAGDQLTDPINVAYRVIADHARCLTFALTDGAHCGNTGRDSVLRTILRRAVRFGHQQLGVEEPFLYKLVPAVVDHFGNAFPELHTKVEAVTEEIKDEEVSFRQTLGKGIGRFYNAIVDTVFSFTPDRPFQKPAQILGQAINGYPGTRVVTDSDGNVTDEDATNVWQLFEDAGLFKVQDSLMRFGLGYSNERTTIRNRTDPAKDAAAPLVQHLKKLIVAIERLTADEAAIRSASEKLNEVQPSDYPEARKTTALALRDAADSLAQTQEEMARAATAALILDGETAFDLEATYGFPFSLTRVMVEELGLTVDEAGYEKAKAKHAEISRGQGGDGDFDAKAALNDLLQQTTFEPTEFVGYDTTTIEPAAQKLRLFKRTGQAFEEVNKAAVGDRVAAVVERTPFYAEAGGQVGDTGELACNCGGSIRITDTQKLGDTWFHLGEVTKDITAAEAAPVGLTVDADRRHRIMCNHTTTHVMNRALRDLVNPEADQKGSLVDDEKLRFDFSNSGPVKPDQLAAVERQVNADIAADLAVDWQVAPQEDALRINGLRAVFGEKYPPEVRVVSVGAKVSDLLANPSSDAWANKSIEFCGGTHLPSTGPAEAFCVVAEENVAKGIRRVTALTGQAARDAATAADELQARLDQLADAKPEELKAGVDAVNAALNETTLPAVRRAALLATIAELNAKLKAAAKQQGKAGAAAAVEQAKAIADQNAGPVIVARLDNVDGGALRSAMDVVKKKHPDAAILLGSTAPDGNKCAFIAAVPKPMIAAGLKAGDWVKQAAQVTGGGGGGRPDSAQAGGKDPAKLDDALDAARDFAATHAS
ncbi:MAG: alanine--tRNA ligase [Planctomycetota bacterium]